MASKKTILSIEATSKEYTIRYSGGLNRQWADLSEKERKEAQRHDTRLMNVLLALPEHTYERFAFIFQTVDKCKRREARRAAKQAAPSEA